MSDVAAGKKIETWTDESGTKYEVLMANYVKRLSDGVKGFVNQAGKFEPLKGSV